MFCFLITVENSFYVIDLYFRVGKRATTTKDHRFYSAVFEDLRPSLKKFKSLKNETEIGKGP